ncbi:hypothetical protein [Streptomyces violascens]|uniref:hypothetical protein n=1 Tax=Streptomyces violascens TaxID=67381 RepID=UPI001679EE39|nr:hypothetical protein [Streptomyces violascens]GGT85126.1 hypothetical protein GCM10010289_00870 [Streptomyces violascens]
MTDTLHARARRRRPPNRPAASRTYAGTVSRFVALLGLLLVLVLAVVLAPLVLAAALVLTANLT